MKRANRSIWKNKFIDIEHPLLEQLHDIKIILSDLDIIERYSQYYTENFSMQGMVDRAQNSEKLPEYDFDHMVSMDCISRYIIILYAKCFDQSSRSRKHFKLSSEIFKKHETLQKQHESLMDWRNKYIIHDESLLGERSKHKVGINEKEQLVFKNPTPSYYFSGGQISEITHLQANIDYIRDYLKNKIVLIQKNIDIQITDPLFKNHQFLLGKISKREKISSDELEKLKK